MTILAVCAIVVLTGVALSGGSAESIVTSDRTTSDQHTRIVVPYDANAKPSAMTLGFWNKAVNTSIQLLQTPPPTLFLGTWAQAPPDVVEPQGGTNHSLNPGFRALALPTPVRGTWINGSVSFMYGHGHISLAFVALTREFISEVRWGGCSVRAQNYVIGGEMIYMIEADLHE